MQTYGIGGMFLVSCLPIILHPVIAFGLITGLSNSTILSVVMGGRTVKYACARPLTPGRAAVWAPYPTPESGR